MNERPASSQGPEDSSPQADQMADESMVRCLQAQARAIWPQERPLFQRYDLPDKPTIVDVGCGTGEMIPRLRELWPHAHAVGIDLVRSHLRFARRSQEVLEADAFLLPLRSQSTDLTICRHVTQAVPAVDRLIKELCRVTVSGGWLHVLAEDYAMIHAESLDLDHDEFWSRGPVEFGRRTGTDLRIGRHIHRILRQAGLNEISAHYVTVDTLRVDRLTISEILVAWRDGYTEVLGAKSHLTPERARAHFQDMIDRLADPDSYFVWQIPVWSARLP